MIVAGMNAPELIGNVLAVFFTFLVLLYAFGDNALFRLATHIFIGVAAGYIGAVAVTQVLVPQFNAAFTSGNYTALAVPLLLLALLFTKISPRLANLGNPVSGLLVGVGAAVAVGGTIQGTLLPQLSAAFTLYSPDASGAGLGLRLFNGSIILLGTVTSLAYFQFSARSTPNQITERHFIFKWLANMGHAFIAITLGIIFAGLYSAALSALIERFDFIITFIARVMAG